MEYKNWYFRDGLLLVEKYSGVVTLDKILGTQEEIFNMERDSSKQMLALSDISEANLDQLGYDEIVNLFELIDQHTEDTNGMKIALYTGNMRFQDFQKAYRYVDEATNRPLSLISFNYLDIAMDWLDLTKEERKKIPQLLGHKSY